MAALILVIGRPFANYRDELLFYSSVAALVAAIARYVPVEGTRLTDLIRLLYPGLLFTFFYRETGGTMFLLFDSFYDWQLTGFEKSVLGVYPTIYIDRHLLSVWLNEIFSLCYFSYYLMIPVFLLGAFIKKDYQLLRSSLTAICLTFFISYFLFFVYPIEGPRWYFASAYMNDIDGPVFRPLTELIITMGAVRGGCMPSSHFAVGLVIFLYCFRYYRKASWLLLPLVIGLGIGTFWGRYHYVSDVIVGGVIGLASTLFIWNYYPVSATKRYNSESIKEPLTENVS